MDGSQEKQQQKKLLLMKRHEKERMNSANVLYLNNSSGKKCFVDRRKK